MLRFNTEYLQDIGFDCHIDGPWIQIQSTMQQEIYMQGIKDVLYDAGLTEGEVGGICDDITEMVDQRIIYKALIRSGMPHEPMPRRKGKAI